jgi:RES domain-containing protein
MLLYRISRAVYARDLSGEGSRRFGGRWNKKGVPVIYTSSHQSLAALEVLVHVPVTSIPEDLQLITLKVPVTEETEQILTSDLPEDWQAYPAPDRLAEIGTNWAKRGEGLLLRVPSAIIPDESNFLINPLHEEARKIEIHAVRDYQFDKRIFS